MNTHQDKKPVRPDTGLIRKLVVSLILAGGLAAAMPNAASAGGKSPASFNLGTALSTASVGWGGCGGCSQ